MPFPRPTLAALVTRIKGDLRGRLEIVSPLLRRAMADVLAIVWAGSVHLLYGYLDWLARQISAKTADRDELLTKAAMYGVVPVPASFAFGNVTATGTNGTVIPGHPVTGTVMRLDAATAYRVQANATIVGGTATFQVVAITAGTAGNLPAGTSLPFETPIAGVNSPATVAVGGIANGEDEEGTEEVRDRLLLRLQRPPEGGADQDYEAWALAVPGVTRAWVYPIENGLGTVVVRFVKDGDVSIFPDAGAVTVMQTALDAKRPVTAQVTAAAPTNLSVPFTIHISPDTADLRTAVQAELVDLFKRVAEPGDGAGRGTVYLSQIRTAIGLGLGEGDNVVTVPAADVVPTTGQLPTVGTISWV